MYTRCTYCGSIYQVDAAILRQAAGQVRCGYCEQSFDALRLLSESFPDDAPPHPLQMAQEQATIGDLFDDRQAANAVSTDEHVLDPDPDGPLSDLTDELEDLVDGLEDLVDGDTLVEELAAAESMTAEFGLEQETLLESTEDADDAWLSSEATGEDWWTPDASAQLVQAELLEAHEPGTDDGEQIPDADAGSVAAEDPAPEPPYLRPEEALAELSRRSRPRLALWISVALITSLAAAAQWVHAERQSLVLHPTLGPRLTEVYRLFGTDLHPDWDPELLRVERTEMVSHPSIPGALYLSGVLSNEAPYPLPLPTLRLRMDNRWGDVVAAREFTPAEYLQSPRDPEGRFAPGERVALGIEIVDPDPEAVGFRVQVCLPADGGERCR